MPLPDGEQEDWCLVEVTGEGLDLGRYTAFVGHPSAGAIASFVGVTRNSFEGKGVLRLEYEAYGPMAVKKLREVCAGMAAQWELVKVAVAHRVGTVAVSEPSVVIAASSAHRKDALEVGGGRHVGGGASRACAHAR